MSSEKIFWALSQSGRFSSSIEEGVIRVSSVDSGSEFIIEEFSESFQVRQAVLFDCQKDEDLDISELYVLCSRVNDRFSGCKCFIDDWDVLVNASDIIAVAEPDKLVETILDQVEFVSQVILDLLDTMRSRSALPGPDEVEAAFQVPPPQ